LKYVKNIPPTDKELSDSLIKAGWKRIKEPSNLPGAIILSIPFMVLGGFFSFLIIALFNPSFVYSLGQVIDRGAFSIDIRFHYILYAYIIIFLHEMVHAVFIPDFIKSEKTYFGIRPWGGFVYTTQKLSKSRFLLITVAPFIILSVFLPAVLGISGLLGGLMAFLVLLNAAASSVDLLNATLIMVQVPSDSMMVNNGFETYYR